jgi:hypothetical protein
MMCSNDLLCAYRFFMPAAADDKLARHRGAEAERSFSTGDEL